MADPMPAERVYVTIADREWELVPTDKLTFPETKEIKRVSEGMALVDLEQGLIRSDGDAWFAWIYVSVRRQQPTLTVAELEAAIGDTPIVAVIETVRREASEVAAPDPPARPSGNASDAATNGSDSGAKTLPLSTLATAGPPTSPTQT